MNLKLITAVAAFAAIPALALAQGAGAPKAAKPTKADAQKVVQTIKGDKAKLDAYCAISKLGDQAAEAEQKKDQKKMDDLQKQADALGQKIGPDYVKFTASMETLDPDSKDGKEIIAILEGLDKMCPK
jgi:Skp family chaperone for outer membrane proteins